MGGGGEKNAQPDGCDATNEETHAVRREPDGLRRKHMAGRPCARTWTSAGMEVGGTIHSTPALGGRESNGDSFLTRKGPGLPGRLVVSSKKTLRRAPRTPDGVSRSQAVLVRGHVVVSCPNERGGFGGCAVVRAAATFMRYAAICWDQTPMSQRGCVGMYRVQRFVI